MAICLIKLGRHTTAQGTWIVLVDDEFFRGGALWGVEAEEVDIGG